jgi:DnaJ-class molecular chaperone
MKVRIICPACDGKCCEWDGGPKLTHCAKCGGSGGQTYQLYGRLLRFILQNAAGRKTEPIPEEPVGEEP